MSKLTEVLKLLCYDPETDGNLTFNVTEALTKNWEKIDQLVLLAVAAAAAYDPEGSYAVGDYCTHGGKLHKCGTAIPDGEAWTAEHWTETSVAAELAEVRASLSNALGLIFVSGETDLGAMPQRPLICLTSKDAVVGLPEGWPQNHNDFIRFFNGNLAYTLDLLANYGNKRLAYRLATGDWYEIATATPPQEFDLPLTSGWSNYSGMRSRYWKNQFDEVSVVVDIRNPNTVSHGAVVATLPEGFRPAAAFDAPTIIYDGSEILPVRAYFSTNGQISISGYSNQTWSKVLFFETQASFIAVS